MTDIIHHGPQTDHPEAPATGELGHATPSIAPEVPEDTGATLGSSLDTAEMPAVPDTPESLYSDIDTAPAKKGRRGLLVKVGTAAVGVITSVGAFIAGTHHDAPSTESVKPVTPVPAAPGPSNPNLSSTTVSISKPEKVEPSQAPPTTNRFGQPYEYSYLEPRGLDLAECDGCLPPKPVPADKATYKDFFQQGYETMAKHLDSGSLTTAYAGGCAVEKVKRETNDGSYYMIYKFYGNPITYISGDKEAMISVTNSTSKWGFVIDSGAEKQSGPQDAVLSNLGGHLKQIEFFGFDKAQPLAVHGGDYIDNLQPSGQGGGVGSVDADNKQIHWQITGAIVKPSSGEGKPFAAGVMRTTVAPKGTEYTHDQLSQLCSDMVADTGYHAE